MVFPKSNEDHTKKISHSVYVTNFPDATQSGDLWKVCSAYGTVIDVYIPNKRAKSGKRFAFVRFIKVSNLARLLENLCTIWIGRYHLYANQVRRFLGFLIELSSSKDKSDSLKHVGIAFMVSDKLRTDTLGYVHLANGSQQEKEFLATLLTLTDLINRQGIVAKVEAPGMLVRHSFTIIHSEGLSCHVMEDAQAINVMLSLNVLSDMAVKTLWGNHRFEFIISDAAGNSGGILCVWDPSFFRKEQHIILDNFVALYGTWIPKKANLLVIFVYAPQPLMCKRVLWDCISILINRWDGHCLVMGDFNEVRFPGDRMGTVFNVQGANEFNCFISNSGLTEVQLEGYSFTWSHPSAKKMSKLDRFFVTDGLLSLFPHISVVCLDRNLSDHHPILLREVVVDYEPYSFRVFHSWWDFLDDVLAAFGFGSKWRLWIRGSLYSGMASVLLNGSPSLEFEFHRGLKQGDPWPLTFYYLIMESFPLSISRGGGLLIAGIFRGINISDDLNISHLFYADDASGLTLIFPRESSSLDSGFLLNLSSIWNSILKEVSNAQSTTDLIAVHSIKSVLVMVFVPNSRTRFGLLVHPFEIFFHASMPRDSLKAGSVASKLLNPINLSLRRDVRDGVESYQLALLEETIGSTILSNMEDRWTWDLNSDRVFRVKDVRNLFDDHFLPKVATATRWVKFILLPVYASGHKHRSASLCLFCCFIRDVVKTCLSLS
ncbi:RNA-directed DNA polymerase, eukaryota [Tanacetum coccineum]